MPWPEGQETAHPAGDLIIIVYWHSGFSISDITPIFMCKIRMKKMIEKYSTKS